MLPASIDAALPRMPGAAPPWRAALALAAAVLAVYLPGLNASFQFDDFRVVVGDARVHSLAAWWQSMPAIRPLLRLSYAVGHELGGAPGVFRAFNIGVHVGNVALVLWLLRGIGTRCGLDDRTAHHSAVLAAALFALHPIATEAVTYVSGRSNSLSATCALGALVLWLRTRNAARPWAWRGAAMAIGLLGVGVKESVAVLPAAMLLVSWLGGAGADGPARREAAALGVFVAVLVLLGLTLAAYTDYPAMFRAALTRRELLPNLLTQAHGVAALLGHVLMPWTVAAELDLRPVTALTPATAAPFALSLAVVGAALAGLRRYPAPAFCVLWMAAWLLPTHTLFAREDIANDRQFYLPLVGAAWLAALAFTWIADALRARASTTGPHPIAGLLAPATTVAAWALVVALGLGTLLHNHVYRNEVAFWEHTVGAAPRNARAANNLGYAYALACRDADALHAFAVAQRLDPANIKARMNRVLLLRGTLFTPGQRSCPAR